MSDGDAGREARAKNEKGKSRIKKGRACKLSPFYFSILLRLPKLFQVSMFWEYNFALHESCVN